MCQCVCLSAYVHMCLQAPTSKININHLHASKRRVGRSPQHFLSQHALSIPHGHLVVPLRSRCKPRLLLRVHHNAPDAFLCKQTEVTCGHSGSISLHLSMFKSSSLLTPASPLISTKSLTLNLYRRRVNFSLHHSLSISVFFPSINVYTHLYFSLLLCFVSVFFQSLLLQLQLQLLSQQLVLHSC